MCSAIKGEMGCGMKKKKRTQFFGGGGGWHPPEKWGSKYWAWTGGNLPSLFLSCKLSYPIKNTLTSVFGLITVIILTRVRESFFFFFQSNRFTACKVTWDGKEMVKSLIVFNLCKFIRRFQSKKYLRTYWNLHFNPQ